MFFLIDPFEGGEIYVSDFRKKAQEICAIPNTDQPFMCFDVTFISVLLEEGFGLKPQTKLKVNFYPIFGFVVVQKPVNLFN